MLILFWLILHVCDFENPAVARCCMMPAKRKRFLLEQHPEEVVSPLSEVSRPLRFCPCCGFPLTQEAREIENQRLAKPVSPPHDIEPLEFKDEECLEGAQTEPEGSESVIPISEEIQTENPDDPIMTTDEYGDGIGIVEGPLSSEAASFPLYPQPPRTPPPAWMQRQHKQIPGSSSSTNLEPFPPLPPPPPPARAGPIVRQAGPKPIGWSGGAWP